MKSYLFIRVHKIEPLHTSSTRDKHQRSKNLLLNAAYTNCQGSWNLVGGLNHNWLNPLQHGYIYEKLFLFIRVHKIEPLHTSSTRDKHQRSKNLLLLNAAYTNCQGSWNLVVGLNHNWLNPLQHGYICKTYLSIPVHKIEPLHTSSTRNMHQRIKNIFLNGAYTNHETW
jgi:hypothetical protein